MFKPFITVIFFLIRSKVVLLLWIPFVILCFVFVILSCLFLEALWSPAGKGLTLGSLVCDFSCVFVTFLYVVWVRCGT